MSTVATRSTGIRGSIETHETLKALAGRAGLPLTQYLDVLAEQERRRVMLEECKAAFVHLKADPDAWAAH